MSGEKLHPVHQAYADALDAGGPARIELGRAVLCDRCSEDLTDDPRSGGLLFGSYAYGPCCEDQMLASIQDYGEEWNINGRCPEWMTFADWCRALRGANNAIVITPGMPGRRP